MDADTGQIPKDLETYPVEETLDVVNDVLENLLVNVETILRNLEETNSRNSLKSVEELKKDVESISEVNETLNEIDPSEYVDAVENEEELVSDASVNLDVSERRTIPVHASLRTPNLFADLSSEEDDQESTMSAVTLEETSDSDNENGYVTAQNSEETGDQDYLVELDEFIFLERMIRYFRDADARLEINRGSGDNPTIDSDDDDDDVLEDLIDIDDNLNNNNNDDVLEDLIDIDGNPNNNYNYDVFEDLIDNDEDINDNNNDENLNHYNNVEDDE